MKPSTFWYRRNILFLLLTWLVVNVATSKIEKRGLGCGSDSNPGEPSPDPKDPSPLSAAAIEAPTNDGPTSDKSAGIGMEFETGQLRFYSKTVSEADTFKLKGKLIGGREGTNWKLTGDTMLDRGLLNAEYILDGAQIKLGSGDLAKATADVANDLSLWDPAVNKKDNKVTVDTSPVDDWKIYAPDDPGMSGKLKWGPQVTAPMPLEAVQDLISAAMDGGQGSPLLSIKKPGRGLVMVTKDFFKTKPGGISSDDVKEDVLGFFSLVLSYAKGAEILDEEQSPKDITNIMPRSDFKTIFDQVKQAVPAQQLYDIVKALACFENKDTSIEVDGEYCTGSVDNPKPNDQMDKQTFGIASGGQSFTLTVKDWIQGISDGTLPDKLTTLDEEIDGSIGGFRGALENVLNTQRAVPLFEFRRLNTTTSSGMEDFAKKVDGAVEDLHKKYASAPKLRKRQIGKIRSPIGRRGIT